MPVEGAICRIKRVQGTPESLESGLKFFREVVTPCCEVVPGFQEGWFAQDRTNSRTITVTLWADTESLVLAMQNLGAVLKADPAATELLASINERGVEFETYELAARSGPRAQ